MAAQREHESEANGAREAADRDDQGSGESPVSAVGKEIRRTLRGELSGVVRDAALEVFTPVARKATTSAAKYAVTRGPELFTEVVAPRLKEAGGPMAVARNVASKAGSVGQRLPKVGSVGQRLPKLGRDGGGGGDGEGAKVSGTGRGRRLPIQEYVDVGVPVEVAYDQWTQFEDFPKFMRGVEQIEQRDDTTLVWHEKLWGVRRSWVAEITDQRPDERIAWHSTSGPQHVGVVTFHPLADRLTRILVTLDHQPTGLFERTASGMRFNRRALESDLRRFKALVELAEEPTGAWRGRIEEGEVAEGEQEPAEDREDREAAERDQDTEREQTRDEREQTRDEREQARDERDEDEDRDEEPQEDRDQARAEDQGAEEPEEAEEPEKAEEPEEEPAVARRRRRARDRAEDDQERDRPTRRRAAASRRQ